MTWWCGITSVNHSHSERVQQMSFQKSAGNFKKGFAAAGILMGLSFLGFFASIKYTERLQREHWRKKREILRQRETSERGP
ncbi:hypothetical protein EmuJ_001046400 [Echinococcus multilocularis]|uniref:Uncharacterized protein n=1 Tax=Echinococcus multilocularis TaxID=6211 RepID=A0A068YKF7_ECHMU|nr:hypothetical protein EmuJ_001046400 [Echinococcus multilocularis]